MPKLSEDVKSKRKKIIIDAAFKVFSTQGYNNTTIDDIVTESGVSKGGIYTYYQSKEEIFLEIAENRFVKRSKIFSEMKQNFLDNDVKINYAFILRNYLTTVLLSLSEPEITNTAKFSFEFWSIVTRDPHLNQLAKKRYSDFFQDLAMQITDGIEAGFFKKNIDIDTVGYIIISTIDGMMHTHAIMGIEIPKDAIELYVDAIMGILLV